MSNYTNMNWYKLAQIVLEFEHIHDDHHSGQDDFTLIAKNASNGQPIAYVQYSLYEDDIYIKYMHVRPELRRQSIGTQMMNDIKREYPTSTINWGGTTPEGNALYESMEDPTNQKGVYKGIKEVNNELV